MVFYGYENACTEGYGDANFKCKPPLKSYSYSVSLDFC